MKYPQVVVYETDGALAAMLKRLASEHSWLIRESRQADACYRLLTDTRPSVLLLKLERELLDGLTLLSHVGGLLDCPVILISDVKMEGAEQRAQLSALAFDLGARYVLFPPLQQSIVEDLVSGLMAATVKRVHHSAAGEGHA